MALFRQGSDRFNFDASQLDAAVNGAGVTERPTATTQAANEGDDAPPQPEATQDDEGLSEQGFGAEYARVRSALSEFSAAEPTTAAGASEKLRRDINSDRNIGGGGGALYTADKNPWGESKEDRDADAANDALGEMVETSQQSLKREREERQRQMIERWEREKFDFFGDEMSEEEWGVMKHNIRNPKMRANIKSKLIADGVPPDKAQEAIDIVDEVAHLDDRVNNGELSAEEAIKRKEELRRRVESDPVLKDAVPQAKHMAKNGVDRDYGATVGTTKDAGASDQVSSFDARDTMLSSGTASSVQMVEVASLRVSSHATASQTMTADKLFASAPPAGEHFAVAASGVPAAPAAPKVTPAATMAAAVKPDALVC